MYLHGTPKDQFKIDVWLNNHFLYVNIWFIIQSKQVFINAGPLGFPSGELHKNPLSDSTVFGVLDPTYDQQHRVIFSLKKSIKNQTGPYQWTPR